MRFLSLVEVRLNMLAVLARPSLLTSTSSSFSPRSITRAMLFTIVQGLTLVHDSAQLEPFLTQKHALNTLDTPYHPLNTPETTLNCTPCHTEGA